MSDFIYLFIVMMVFLIFYVLIGQELMNSTLLFLIFITLLGSRNENK
jgi:type IV secretory pathway VirB3-like protein